jgi:hypothetical protein
MIKLEGVKLIKNYRNLGVKIDVKNRPKKQLKNQFSRGGPGGSKMIKIDVWDPGGQFINFLKFCSFLQKLPHFSTPKSTPINGPIKMSFPTNRLYFSQNGGPKMSLFGGSGGGPLGPKKVDTTI